MPPYEEYTTILKQSYQNNETSWSSISNKYKGGMERRGNLEVKKHKNWNVAFKGGKW